MQRRENKGNGEQQKTMRFAGLKNVCNGGKYIRQMRGEQEFAKAAIDKAKRRNGIDEDNDEGKQEKEESGESRWLLL